MSSMMSGQSWDPLGAAFPTGHSWHSLAALPLAYLPASHDVHSESTGLDIVQVPALDRIRFDLGCFILDDDSDARLRVIQHPDLHLDL